MRSDEDLLEGAAHGDVDAFAEFYRRHVAAITTFLRRRCGSTEVAFDLAAESFASAVAGLGTYRRDRGSARGWLFAIALDELRQAQRKGVVEERARRRLELEPILLDDEALARVEEIVNDGALSRALGELPETERAAVQARVVDERDYADVAQEIGCSAMVVRQRVSRGLRRIRAMAEETP
jgi:RNA polymerase sigma factor (sigma-70 family)